MVTGKQAIKSNCKVNKILLKTWMLRTSRGSMQAQGADEVENGVNTFRTYTNYINCTLFQGTKYFLLLI